MKSKYLLFPILCLLSVVGYAQALKGSVTEMAGKEAPLANVFIKNINNKQIALTDKKGYFEIGAKVNQTLVFSCPGYVSDTLFVTNLQPKTIKLPVLGINLREVSVRETNKPFNPREEYPDVYEKSKFAMSPSRWFGKEARNARRLKAYFENEEEQRQIDAVYTKTFVSSILPLKGQELDNFMTMYRPTLSFVKTASPQTMTVYVNDSYRSF